MNACIAVSGAVMEVGLTFVNAWNALLFDNRGSTMHKPPVFWIWRVLRIEWMWALSTSAVRLILRQQIRTKSWINLVFIVSTGVTTHVASTNPVRAPASHVLPADSLASSPYSCICDYLQLLIPEKPTFKASLSLLKVVNLTAVFGTVPATNEVSPR